MTVGSENELPSRVVSGSATSPSSVPITYRLLLMETIQTKIDSLLQGTANAGSVGDLTLKELVLSNPPNIPSLL